MRRIVLISEDYFGLAFPYNAGIVDKIKRLANRRWNPEEKWWEIHVAHLPEVMAILKLNQAMIPPDVRRAYETRWKDVDGVVCVSNDYTILSGAKLPFEAIDEAISYWKLGAEHTTKYKEGQWDGMRRLLDKRNSRFPTGLLDRVLTVLDRHGVRYRLEDERAPAKPSLELRTPPRKYLRDYQQEALDIALESGRGILEMATGSGKTVLAAYIIGHLKRPTIFFVHTKDLLYQTKNLFADILKTPIGQIGDGVVEVEPINVAMIQTCSQALGVAVGPDPDAEESSSPFHEPDMSKERSELIVELLHNVELVFFDECHHVPADTCFALALNLPKAFYRYGLSATPYRSDRQDMLIEAALGKKIDTVNASDLIDRGYLVPPLITFFVIPACNSKSARRYHDIYQLEIVENEARNRLIAEMTLEFVSQKKTALVLVTQIKHGELLNELLPEAPFLTGKDTSAVRNEVLDGLRSREIPAVIATTLADEGLDIPSLDVLILAGGGKSETRALQRIGRALRQTEGKQFAIVVDFFDQARFLSEHSKKRLEIYETERRFQIEMTNPWTGENANCGRLYEKMKCTKSQNSGRTRRAKRPQS